MKIAFLTPEYPHAKTGSCGGIGTCIKNLAIGLIAQGCAVRVLVYGQKEDAVFKDNGITIQQIKNVKLKGLSWWLTRKKLERIINQLHTHHEIDLVEAPDWTGITSYIQPRKCPIIIRLHGSDTYFCHLDNRQVKRINKFHERRALQKADALLSVSRFTADVTNEVFGLKKKFTIIPNGTDTTLFSKSDSSKLIPPLGGMEVLYFGSLIRKKGVLELPLIFNEVIKTDPETKLILVGKDVSDILTGNNSTWSIMQSLFTKEALQKVSYVGSVPYSEIRKQIEQAAVCIFPSFAEALPVSWLEAMSMQKPVVASDIGWATEIIENEKEGFLVNPKQHNKYAMRITTLLNNPNLMLTFGAAARKKVEEKFSVDVISMKNLEFYNSVSKKLK
jgi:glycosyltransferase involved in cell wall biosynthesis